MGIVDTKKTTHEVWEGELSLCALCANSPSVLSDTNTFKTTVNEYRCMYYAEKENACFSIQSN